MTLKIVMVAALLAITAACDSGGSGADPTATAGPVTDTSTPSTPVGTDGARLKVERWGITSDGLISVVVRNVGTASVRSARAIIDAQDAYGNSVAAVSAIKGTPKGTRCCTVIGVPPGSSYGLYSEIGKSRIKLVKRVEVQYADVRSSPGSVPLPVVAASNASLDVNDGGATVSVTLKMSKSVGPFITAQALLDGPNGDFLGVISGGFFCLQAGSQRTIKLQFYHPVPAGSTVDRVVTYPLDRATAQVQHLKSCG